MRRIRLTTVYIHYKKKRATLIQLWLPELTDEQCIHSHPCMIYYNHNIIPIAHSFLRCAFAMESQVEQEYLQYVLLVITTSLTSITNCNHFTQCHSPSCPCTNYIMISNFMQFQMCAQPGFKYVIIMIKARNSSHNHGWSRTAFFLLMSATQVT